MSEQFICQSHIPKVFRLCQGILGAAEKRRSNPFKATVDLVPGQAASAIWADVGSAVGVNHRNKPIQTHGKLAPMQAGRCACINLG